MDFAHRTNTFASFYEAYYLYGYRHFEIDVQPTKDGHVVVYHDDVSDKTHQEMAMSPTLEEFCKFTPDAVTVNVEIKKYANSGLITDEVLDICKRYPNKLFIFSSFDEVSVEILREKAVDSMLLIDTIDKYKPTQTKICIQKGLLPVINLGKHETVFVYDVKASDVGALKQEYPLVQGWILDY